MFCNNCGSQLPENASFCNNCGATLVAANNNGGSDQQQQPSSQPTYQQNAYEQPVNYQNPPIENYPNQPMQQNPQPVNNIPGMEAVDDSISVGLVILAVIIPIFGLIYWGSKAKTRPRCAKACGIAAIISIVVGIVVTAL